mgnify:CR=1 FL=1
MTSRILSGSIFTVIILGAYLLTSGDMIWVKVTEIDEKGRVNLSYRDALREIKAKKEAGLPIK